VNSESRRLKSRKNIGETGRNRFTDSWWAGVHNARACNPCLLRNNADTRARVRLSREVVDQTRSATRALALRATRDPYPYPYHFPVETGYPLHLSEMLSAAFKVRFELWSSIGSSSVLSGNAIDLLGKKSRESFDARRRT